MPLHFYSKKMLLMGSNSRGGGPLGPRPDVRNAGRLDLSAEPPGESYVKSGWIIHCNSHQVESPVFNANQVLCQRHLCAAEYRGRRAPKFSST